MTKAVANGAADCGTVASTTDPRWRMVCERDRAADGSFYYSVATTGIFCRPSCPSRVANVKNVRFHATVADCEANGFRACRRCRPELEPADVRIADRIALVCRLIDEAEEPPNLKEMARVAGLSPFYFHRVFKAATGVTPRSYSAARRADRVRERLTRSHTVTEAIYDAGFNSNGRFYETSDAMLGMTPTSYRAGGLDTRIRFAVGECSLGAILVARSDRGVCAISLGSDPDALVRELQVSFPNADLIGADAEFELLVAQVVGLIESPGTGLDLPLEVRGTAFQRRVWQALRDIPAGSTVSYADVARRIGSPAAVRAVASACGANRLAVAIPCHRVVRGDGALSGYRWGVERKRALIDREATQA